MPDLKKPLKYFVVPIANARDWDWRDYVLFVIESFYTTIFPFFAGVLLVERKELIWIVMLVLPIYFKFKVERKFAEKSKKVYVR